MRTNIELDDELVNEARELTGITTKRAVVHEALRVLIASRKRLPLADLVGKVRFTPGYDYKATRRRT